MFTNYPHCHLSENENEIKKNIHYCDRNSEDISKICIFVLAYESFVHHHHYYYYYQLSVSNSDMNLQIQTDQQ